MKRKASIEMKGKEEESKELYAAVENHDVEKVKSILKRGIADVDWNKEEDVFTALTIASYKGNLEICNLLIKAGAKIDLLDNLGFTALTAACEKGNFEVCKFLIEAAAKVDLQNKNGTSALYIASQEGHLKICKLLIKARAKLDLQNKYGDTALSLACIFGHQDIASFLLAEGAAHGFKNHEGKTAGDYAVELHGWNWNRMVAEADLSFFDHVFDCMINADHSPVVEKKRGRKRKRGEVEEEKKEELPFLLRFMKRVYSSDFMMSKNVLPKLSFNPGTEAGEGMQVML